MSKLKINPEYDKLIPPLPKSDYDELKKSIQTDGLYHGITVNEKNEILDGHHRYRACQDLGIEFKTDIKKFDSQFAEKRFVIKSNFTRRHLEIYQRAALADELHKIELEERKQKNVGLETDVPKPTRKDTRKHRKRIGKKVDPEVHKKRRENKSRQRAAKQSNLSDNTLRKYQHVLYKSKNPELKDSMTKGLVSINEAYNTQKKMEERQKLIDIELPSLPSNIKLIEGDCSYIGTTDEITDESISLIFTDPPYDRKSLDVYDTLGRVAADKLEEGGSLVTYAGAYELPTILGLLSNGLHMRYWWTICVKHTGRHASMFQKGVFVHWKPLLWFVKGTLSDDLNHVSWPRMKWLDSIDDYIESEQPDKILHEWEQSTIEAEYIISKLTVGQNQIVLDPFMGSGTTGIAALRQKRKFIGIEKEPEQFQIAKKRLEKWADQK